MPFKINFGTENGKTFKLEIEALDLIGKKLGELIKGEEISPDLAGYEFEITGASDKSGFTLLSEIEGNVIKRPLLTYGKAMHKKSKGDKKISRKPAGLRLRKTVRGNTISEAVSQINLKTKKQGSKNLSEIFPDQNKAPEPAPVEIKEEAKPAETDAPKEEIKPQETPSE